MSASNKCPVLSPSRRSHRGRQGRPRLFFETLEIRLALAVNVEDFSNDFDSTVAGYDSWDADPSTAPGGDTDTDPATTLGPDELLIPHDVGPRSRFDFNRHGNTTQYLAIVGGLSPETYVIDFAGGRGQPGGLAADAEVVTVGFRYNGGGRVEVVGDHGVKNLDVSNFASWVGLAVTSNDPADSGGEIGAIQRIRFTAGGDLLNVDDVSVLVIDAGFSNNTPVAADDALVVRAGAAYDIDVLFNDADLDQDTLAIAGISSPPLHGTAVVQGDRVHYLAAPGYLGPDSFDYTISDGRGGADAATVSISVEAPLAVDDFTATRPGVAIDIDVLENEIDPGGIYPLFIVSASNPGGGTVAIQDGLIKYSPGDRFHGEDHFSYTIVDQFGNSSSANVTIIVNAPPTAPSRSFALPHNFTGTFSLPPHSLYDGGNLDPSDDLFDPDGDSMQISGEIVETPYGAVTIDSDGSLTYEPATPGDLVVPVAIPYHVRDAFGALGEGEIQFVATNFTPSIEDVFHHDHHGIPTPIRISLPYHDSDHDPVSFQIVEAPAYGAMTFVQPEIDGTSGDTYLVVEYDSVFHSLVTSDHFTYRVSDRYAQSNISSVTIDVLNHAPTASVDRFSLGAMQWDDHRHMWIPDSDPLEAYYDSRGSVVDNDFDSDPGDAHRLEAVLVSDPLYGTLEYFRPDGTFRYIPPAAPIDPDCSYPVGRDNFTYRVTDGVSSALAQVTIAIKDNSGGGSLPDSYSTLRDTQLTASAPGVRGNDLLDPQLDPLTTVLVEQPRHGTISFSETGAFNYYPDAGFLGVDFFAYDLTDDFIRMVSPGESPDPIEPSPTWVRVLVHTDDDADGDGISNRTEDLNPLVNPDYSNLRLAYSHQAEIVALPAEAGSITLMAYPPRESDGAFTDVRLASIAPLGAPQPPGDYDLPFGYLSFKYHLAPGNHAQTFRIYVPTDIGNEVTYLKYGPEPDNEAPHWYQPDELTNTIEEILSGGQRYRLRYLEFKISDGRRGDDDLLANGEIVDPGVVAVARSHPPHIDWIVINDGSAQRSKINSLTVTFDSAVTFDPGAFELIHESGLRIALTVAASQIDGRTVAVLTFSGHWIVGGSLFNGDYALVVHGDKVHNQAGVALDGNNDGTAGGDHRAEFFRRFGDSDGDGDVDRFDRQRFQSTFLRRAGDPNYLWYFDWNGDGRIAVLDLLALTIASIGS